MTPKSSYRGYQFLGSNVTRYDGGFQRDWHEALDLYKDVRPHVGHIFSVFSITDRNEII